MDAQTYDALQRRYRRERGQRARRLCLGRKFGDALLLYGSHERAIKLLEWRDGYGMTTDELRSVLQEWWCIIEGWSTIEWNKIKLGWLREVGYISDSRCHLRGELTIYRGNLGEREPAGLSWTLSQREARRFALHGKSLRGAFLSIYREDGVPTVWRATVDSTKVLAYFGSRGEQEVIVDPTTLRDIEVVSRPRPRRREAESRSQ